MWWYWQMMVLFTVAFDAIFVYACSLAIEDKKILSVFSHLTRYTFFYLIASCFFSIILFEARPIFCLTLITVSVLIFFMKKIQIS